MSETADRRVPVVVRMTPAGRDHLQELADREAAGNLSQMVRALLTEALTTRGVTDTAGRRG